MCTANFLTLRCTHTLKKENGLGLKQKTIIEYLRKVFAQTRERFGKDARFVQFFAIADDEKRSWLRSLVQEIVTIKFLEAESAGETVTEQASAYRACGESLHCPGQIG